MSTPVPQPDPTIEGVRQSDRRAIQNARDALDAAVRTHTQARARLAHALYVASVNDVLTPAERTGYARMSDESRRRWERAGAPARTPTPTPTPQELTP